jgi:hypothetical protein
VDAQPDNATAKKTRMAAANRSLKCHFKKRDSSIVVVESMGATLIEDHGDVSGQSPGASGLMICSFNGKPKATLTDSPTPAASR